ncbi:MAG: NAD(P)H-hydrate dehydratase, partial [bacterium]
KVAFNMLKSIKVPMIIDADALNVIAKQPDALRKAAGQVVITPHAGEMARLCGGGMKEVQAARLATATAFAKKHKVITLLKGAHSITASPDGHVFVNPTGNPGMATAGSGDVLSGIIGALAAGGVPPLEAAASGAYIHGLAGDLAMSAVGERSLTATGIIRNLPKAIAEILK